jgi:hypothetical protein
MDAWLALLSCELFDSDGNSLQGMISNDVARKAGGEMTMT